MRSPELNLATVFDVVVDETGHERIVAARMSKRCIHGKAVKLLVKGGYSKLAEVCPTCTYEVTRLIK